MERTLISKDIFYTLEQQTLINQLESDLKSHMYDKNPKRFAHSISVGHCAETLAQVYGADMFSARVAGILHDWEKLLSDADTLKLAERFRIQVEAPYQKIVGLLHGPLAAKTLPAIYPWLSNEILSAIQKHTAGDRQMSKLDKILYVADLIEPLRPNFTAVEESRNVYLRGGSLDELYESAFCNVMMYVISSRRYLYPNSIALYNEMIEKTSK
ncbi:bis(5'-nucleosyl)-tetraphosphatase (symmetrical) YqeK [Lancefieldella parvula]|uniref:bis(5'-nucleosyl)-tetraphosphatase (symmetrical) YqeK n=1 Tax=Lancefieldella parvula TaxID=1382 RepID=UPI002880BBCA|nr:bis(5'-nucleosyl)-tetraphosphatase (symmetrical) YqeK [Lancefieldella parvula]MDU4867671.1 bis(5'-nucleosyl)-tetraphosphatase (symmetrical) YqeK [Lancefieldella parvula]